MSGEWADSWDELRARDAPARGWVEECLLGGRDPLRTGTPLDRVLGGGLMPGVTVLGGQASVGKSALACQAAANVAARGLRVLYLTLDDSWENVWARCASAWSCSGAEGATPFRWSDVPAERGRLRAEQHSSDRGRWAFDVCQGVGMARTAQLFAERVGPSLALVDSMGTVGEVEGALSLLGEPPALVVVDYLQQFRVGDQQADGCEYSRVSAAASAFQRLAIGLRVPVLELSSLRKLGRQDSDPSLDWFRGSGVVGYAAQAAVVVTRRKGGETDGARPVALNVVKNKAGRAGFATDAWCYGAWSVMREGRDG